MSLDSIYNDTVARPLRVAGIALTLLNSACGEPPVVQPLVDCPSDLTGEGGDKKMTHEQCVASLRPIAKKCLESDTLSNCLGKFAERPVWKWVLSDRTFKICTEIIDDANSNAYTSADVVDELTHDFKALISPGACPDRIYEPSSVTKALTRESRRLRDLEAATAVKQAQKDEQNFGCFPREGAFNYQPDYVNLLPPGKVDSFNVSKGKIDSVSVVQRDGSGVAVLFRSVAPFQVNGRRAQGPFPDARIDGGSSYQASVRLDGDNTTIGQVSAGRKFPVREPKFSTLTLAPIPRDTQFPALLVSGNCQADQKVYASTDRVAEE